MSSSASSLTPGARQRLSQRHGSPAFVLHSHDWSESSLILDLFTREHGRVVAVAKGAKRPTSQLRSVLLPFQRISVAFGSKTGPEVEVWLLRHAEWGGGSAWPGGAALLPGFYVNELLMRLLTRHDQLPRLWAAYAELLPALTLAGTLHAALRAFELVLLRDLGHLPDLSRTSAGTEALDDDLLYTLHPELGVREADSDDAMLPGWLWRQLERDLSLRERPGAPGLPDALLQTCLLGSGHLRHVLRGVLQYHAGPQPLKTRQLMMDLQPATPE